MGAKLKNSSLCELSGRQVLDTSVMAPVRCGGGWKGESEASNVMGLSPQAPPYGYGPGGK